MSAWYHCKTDHTAFHTSITFVVGCQHDVRPDVICRCKRWI